MRLRLDLSYDGTDFSGWAAQRGLRTVQETLEDALATALRLPEARLTVAGRTDAGVHARGQVGQRGVSRGEPPHDVAPGRVGERREDPRQLLLLLHAASSFNQLVER